MHLRKWPFLAGGVLGIAAAVTAVALVLANSGAPEQPVEAKTTAPTPTPTPIPADMPVSVPAFGEIADWVQAPTTSVARVLPQVGDAASGSVAAYIDAPVVDGEITVLESTVTVEPGRTYDFSAQTRALSPLPAPVAAAFLIGETRIDIPDLDASWSEVTASYVAPADATSVAVRVVLDGPVSGLGVDDVTLSPATSGANVILNPSFENVSVADVIVNRSLILSVDRPLLAVRVPKGTTIWQAQDEAGQVVARGSAEITHDLDALSLDDLEQGYYTVTVVDATGSSVSANVGVIDYDETAIAVDERFGVGLHVERPWYDDAADLASSLGLGLARNDILWKNNETIRGQYDFDPRYVDGFARLHAHGIHLLGIANYGNKLYGSELTPETPEALAAYGKYAAAIAERFDLVGLEVFNEFNQERFNRTACGTDPTCYLPLLKVVREEVGQVDDELPVIAGATARYDAEWFDGLWKAGSLPYADAVSFHPYEVSSNPESLAQIIAQANSSMLQNAGETRPIWISELGTSSKTGGRTVTVQADYLVRTAITALASGVEKYFWYDLVNDSPDPAVHEGNFGMYYQKATGVAALQPKPVGYAQALMISELGGRDYLDTESLGDGVVSHRFGNDAEAVRVVWAPAGDTRVAIPTDVPLSVVTMAGSTSVVTPVKGTVTITAGKRPLFISTATDLRDRDTPSPAVSQSPPS